MKKLNNRGFGLVGVLAVIVVLAVAGGIGAYVYHKHHKTSSTTTSGNTSNNSDSTGKSGGTTQTPVKYFTISEWGIKAPYSGSLTLQYAMSDASDMSLSSAELAAGGPAVCTYTANGEAGILGRYLPTDANLRPGVPATETAQQYVAQNSTVPHAEVGNYIYIYWGGSYVTNGSYNGPCQDKTVALQTIEAFSSIVPKFQAAQ